MLISKRVIKGFIIAVGHEARNEIPFNRSSAGVAHHGQLQFQASRPVRQAMARCENLNQTNHHAKDYTIRLHERLGPLETRSYTAYPAHPADSPEISVWTTSRFLFSPVPYCLS